MERTYSDMIDLIVHEQYTKFHLKQLSKLLKQSGNKILAELSQLAARSVFSRVQSNATT